MTRKIGLLWAALASGVLAVGLAYAGETSGLGKGEEVPTIHIDAFNDSRGNYCVTCEAGKRPAVVSFVTAADDATKKLMKALDAGYKANRDKRLFAGIVILGDGEAAKALRQFASDSGLQIPTGQIAGETNEVKRWKLNSKVSSTTFFISQHKVQANLADLDADQVGDHLADIVG